ncbi:hypothetical protein CFIMG_007892RA00001 [Ceratocystis fimbriata CBS 114723]|uniref:Uncharacterized protein n=1 Tax=Ceratocystis fimbriata CBS 114723 TaxID=1035309 RepID=A0A2C5X9L8_9PEZI|nr:hypothetical protein CFIMG_007892RA00001 [Ceratocystis fimbriata CBS 114723]
MSSMCAARKPKGPDSKGKDEDFGNENEMVHSCDDLKLNVWSQPENGGHTDQIKVQCLQHIVERAGPSLGQDKTRRPK